MNGGAPMNLIDKKRHQEQISDYEKTLDDISKALLNNELQDVKTIRELLTKSYSLLGQTKLLLSQADITMERDYL